MIIPYIVDETPNPFPMPRLTLQLVLNERRIQVSGLVDSGSAINVLPFSAGQALGARWSQISTIVPLSGSLQGVEAKPLVVRAAHPELTPPDGVQLVFAWAESDSPPVIFGQTNFFQVFNVWFFGSRRQFEVVLAP